MAITAWPFDGTDTTETQYGTLFRTFQDAGLAGIPGDGDASVSANSGLTVTVAPFTLAVLAGVAVTSTQSTSVTITSPSSTQARVDRVVLRIDSGANTATVAALTGTAGSTAAPAVTQTPGGVFEVSLARITVPANTATITSGNVTDERPWLGKRVGQWTTGTRPGNPSRGDTGYNHSLLALEAWNGSTWVAPGASTGGTTTPGGEVTATTAFQPAAGWTVLRQRCVKVGRVASVDLALTRTGANIGGVTDGNIGNIPIGSISGTAWTPSNDWASGATGPDGAIRAVSIRKSDMNVWLTAMPPNDILNTNDTLSATFTYITAA